MQIYNIDKKIIEVMQQQIIDEEALKTFIYRQVKKQGYSSYLDKIIFNNKETEFSPYLKELYINYQQLIEEGIGLFEHSYLTHEKKLFINTWILFIILHEMGHIVQRSYFEGNCKNYFEFHQAREINFYSLEIDEQTYDKYHDYFLAERLATFTSFGSLLHMYQKTKINDNVYDCFLQYFIGYLQRGYEVDSQIKSPMETVLGLMKLPIKDMKKIVPKEDLSILKKAELGLPLELEQYNKIRKKVINKYLQK